MISLEYNYCEDIYPNLDLDYEELEELDPMDLEIYLDTKERVESLKAEGY